MTIGERLQPTIDAATNERDKAVRRGAYTGFVMSPDAEHAACTAKMTGYSLNVAIAVQVLLGALTTGLGAALSGKSVCIMLRLPLAPRSLASLTRTNPVVVNSHIDPRRRLDARRFVSRPRTWFKRAPVFTAPRQSSQSVPPRGSRF
jgi:SMODS and SLOG-associating 2TM effector domain